MIASLVAALSLTVIIVGATGTAGLTSVAFASVVNCSAILGQSVSSLSVRAGEVKSMLMEILASLAGVLIFAIPALSVTPVIF